MIACVDVDYRDHHARAACAVIEQWPDARPRSTYLADLGDILPYEPGSFYRRELPCLLAVLQLLPIRPEIIVVDGYVQVSGDGKAGLGLHLYTALDGTSAVVGVAKTEFAGVSGSSLVVPVLRGRSKKPLYVTSVTSVGIDLDHAATFVKAMHGEHRIPAILRYTDQMARSKGPIANETGAGRSCPTLIR